MINPCWLPQQRTEVGLLLPFPTQNTMKYFQACNIYNDIRHNRQQKDDFDAAGSGGGGESDKN